MWYQDQKKKLNNFDDEIYIKLSTNEYVKENLDKYLQNVKKNEGKEKLEWEQSKSLVFQYCDNNKCAPQCKTIYENQNIGTWLNHQKQYINGVDDELYKKLSVNKYIKENLDEYLNPDKKWNLACDLLFKYSDLNKCAPPKKTIYENYKIGSWLSSQKGKIDNMENELYKKLSVNEYVKENLDKYFENVKENEGKEKLNWEQSKNLLFKYCEENKCCPLQKTIYENKIIGNWLGHQKCNIKSIDDELYKKLSANEYVKENLVEYLNPVKKWDISCELFFKYVSENKCVPQSTTKYEDYNLGSWYNDQKKKVNKVDDEMYKKLSVNGYVKKNLDEYLEYLEKNKGKEKLEWEQSKNLLFEYCENNKCTPPNKTIYKNQSIGCWMQAQKGKISNINDDLYIKLSQNKYVKEKLDEYLRNVEKNKGKEKLDWEQWKNLVFQYCNENKCAPQNKTIYKNQNIGLWLNVTQKRNINSVDDELYKKLSVNQYVKENLDEYLNPDKKWGISCKLLFSYTNKYKCTPPGKTNYENYNIGQWYQDQKKRGVNSIEDDMYKKLSANEYVKKNLDEYLNKKK